MNKIIILMGKPQPFRREKDHGNVTLEDIKNDCNDFAAKNKIKLSFYQSNIEGKLVDEIQKSRNNQDGLIINAGGYTHTCSYSRCLENIKDSNY